MRITGRAKFTDNPQVENFLDLLCGASPRNVVKVLHKEGYVSPRNEQELNFRLGQFVNEEGEEAIAKLLDMHPHKQMILERAEENGEIQIIYNTPRNKGKQKYSFSNFDGEGEEVKTTDSSGNTIITKELIKANTTTNMLLSIGILVLIVIFINKNI